MDTMNRPNYDGRKEAHVTEAAADLVNEGKKYANEVYQQGVNKIEDVEDTVKEYSDKLIEIIQEKPLTAIMVAAGVGMLLASILKKG